MPEIPPETEAQLAGLSESEWAALSARVRAPDTREQLRTAAAEVLSGDALDAYVESVDLSKFTGENGEIDGTKVKGRLTALFGTTQRPNWGQVGTTPPGLGPGESGLIEAEQRRIASETSSPTPRLSGAAGSAGHAEALRRAEQRKGPS